MLRLYTLGAFEIRHQDGRLLSKPPTVKSQSLLAFLACHPTQSHPRENFTGMFWGDRPERKARRSLSTALWHIRRCLPEDAYVLSDAHAVQFNPDAPFWLDTMAFVDYAESTDAGNLQSAAALYQGHFLEGFYDDWILTERYRLESVFADVLARLMSGHEAAGAFDEALATAVQLLAQDPLREDAHRVAMRSHCQLGQRSAALKQYERCRQSLQDDLGVEPLAETRDLWQAIQEGRFACLPQIATEPQIAPVPQLRQRGYNPLGMVERIPLVGREQELAFLATAWQAALANQCSLVLISGEAGVGKTRLVQEFSTQLRWQGLRILQGRCYEFERLVPYQPFTEALQLLPPDLAVGTAGELPPWAADQLTCLMPELLTQPAAQTPLPVQAGEEQTRLFESLSQFLIQLAAQEPLLLILEDLHWATDSVLQLLHYLARHLVTQPLLIVGTLRPEAVSPVHPLAAVGRRLDRDSLARRLQLAPLSKTAVETLVCQMSGNSEAAKPLADRLYLETEGNPFYLIETVKALFEQGAIWLDKGVWQADFDALSMADMPFPASVEETIQARLGRLSQTAQDAAHVAAVVGKTFDYDLLHQAWGQSEAATLTALDDLLRQLLIEEELDTSDYAFAHHKIQEVVYQNLPRHRRSHLHARIGAAMEVIHAAGLEEIAGELGYHFERALLLNEALSDKAIMYLQQAGDQALRAYAHREAVGFYQRALSALDTLPAGKRDGGFERQSTVQLYEKLADTYQVIGDIEQARFAYERALQNTPQSGRIMQARLHYKLATMIDMIESDQSWHALTAAEAALGDHPLQPADVWWETWLNVQMRQAMVYYWQSKPQEMNVQVNRIKPFIEEYGTQQQQAWFFGLLGNTGFALDRFVPSPRTLQYCREGLFAAQKTGDPLTVSDGQFRLGFALLWLGQLDEAERLIRESLAYADLAGIVNDQMLCLTYLTVLFRKRQRVKQTAQLAGQSLEISRKMQTWQYVMVAHGNLSWVAWRGGDLARAEKEGKTALDIWQRGDAKKIPLFWTAAWSLIGLALAANNIARAITYVRMILDPSQQRLPQKMTAALQAAVAALDDGRSDQAKYHLQKAAVTAADQGFL